MAVAGVGRAMIFAAWALLLALVAWLFQGELDRQINPNTEPVSSVSEMGRREVVLARNRAGQYVVTGEINGVPVPFLLDTGATDVAMSAQIARQLGLSPGPPVTLATANGVSRGARTVIDDVAIGPIHLRDVAAVISPGIDDRMVLLGMSFLRHLELTQRDGELILRQ